MLLQMVLLISLFVQQSAIQIPGCGNQTWGVEIEENSNNDPIVCDQFGSGDVLKWVGYKGQNALYAEFGMCSVNDGCDPTDPNEVVMSRPSLATASTMTFRNATRLYGDWDVGCTATTKPNNAVSTARCRINIVYAARPSETSCNVTVHPNRTMTGTCTMSKVYSSVGYYTCQLRQQNVTGTLVTSSNYKTSETSGNSQYYNGTCSLNTVLPVITGTLTYVVVVYPGAAAVYNITIKEPGVNPIIQCNVSTEQYIAENSNVSCNCSVSDIGQPAGRLRFYHGTSLIQDGTYGSLVVTFTAQSVNRNNNQLRCELDWITDSSQDRTAKYSFNVAYGPSSAVVTNPGVYERHPVSPVNLTLYCTANDVQPNVKYSWSSACSGSNVNTCAFTPKVTDNGRNVTCTVTNTITGTTKTDSVNLTVYYPPTSAPDITANPPGAIYEGQTLNINCTVTGGNPPVTSVTVACGVQEQTVNGASNVINLTATSSLDGQMCVCSANWQKTPDWYTSKGYLNITVYHGPQSVNISGPSVFLLHPVNPGQLTLTCSATGYKPDVTYRWSGACANFTSSTCSFTPTASNNGDVINCMAINTATRSNKTASWQLSIRYPPSETPTITGYNVTGDFIFNGQTRNMTCTVSGGNPPVTSVTFGCGSQTQPSNGTSKVISVTADPSKNGLTCECSATWQDNPAWYNATRRVNLTVYYAPEPPNISHPNQTFPFLVGESPTLVCTLQPASKRGNPPATVTWQGHGTTGQGQIRLTPLNSSSHNKSEFCNAINAYTDYSKSPVTTEFVVQVYYVSDVKFQPLPNNDCVLYSLPEPYCDVKEGLRVLVNCSALGNPPIATAAWQQGVRNVLDLVANRSMPIVQTCIVVTQGVDGDRRLPLTENHTLSVFTTYPGKCTYFNINNQDNNHTTHTVNETDQITFTCRGEGRPTPVLTIVKGDTTLGQGQEGQANSVLDTVNISHVIPNANCEEAGVYGCKAGIDGDSITQFLYVNCGPRTNGHNDLLVNYIGKPEHFTFDLVAYPIPHKLTFTRQDQNESLSKLLTPEKLNVTCNGTNTSYTFKCVITVNNIESTLSGNYSLALVNDFGSTDVSFRVTYNETMTPHEPSADTSLNPAIIGGAVAAAIVLAACVILVVFVIFRRRNKGSKSKTERRPFTRPNEDSYVSEQDVTIKNDAYVSTDDLDIILPRTETPVNSAYEEVDITFGKPSVHPKPNFFPKPGLSNATPGCTETKYQTDADVYAKGNKPVKPTTSKGAPSVQPDPKRVHKTGPSNYSKGLTGTNTKPQPQDGADLYAMVNKPVESTSNHVPTDKSQDAQSGTTRHVKNAKALKQEKEKQKEKTKGKGAKAPTQKVHDETGVIYGRSPLSMNPVDNSVYENHTFQADEAQYTNTEDTKHQSSSLSPDGLTYTTIVFTAEQKKKAKILPPGREVTEYATIASTGVKSDKSV